MIVYKKNNYEEDEKLFSTGDSELDDLLEEVYYSGISDGYDYAQKEFAKYEEIGQTLVDHSKFTKGPGRWTSLGGRTPNKVNSNWYLEREALRRSWKTGATPAQRKVALKKLLGLNPYESTKLGLLKAAAKR